MTAATAAGASLPYDEPGIEDVLILSTFLLALNIINSVLDRALYCGLVGQVLVGIAWGTPGAKWLSSSLEDAIVQLGYLGLVMIVYEGGLSTSLTKLRANLPLAVGMALTGVAAPMGLSFLVLPRLAGAGALQCLAAGAALASTSLGTTFAVLGASGLAATRLGAVLAAAAMLDDVAGLVMAQVVAGLGNAGGAAIAAGVVLRPVLASLALAVLVPLALRLAAAAPAAVRRRLRSAVARAGAPGLFLAHTALLIALVAGAAYAGASVLLAAYLAGIAGAWWDDQYQPIQPSTPGNDVAVEGNGSHVVGAEPSLGASDLPSPEGRGFPVASAAEVAPSDFGHAGVSCAGVYEHYCAAPVERVLKPFFFASIGFSVPVTQIFSGPVAWRGIIYSILMLFGKCLCGLWLVRFSVSPKNVLHALSSPVASGLLAVTRRLRLGRLVHETQGKPELKSAAPVSVDPRPQTQEPVLCENQAPSVPSPTVSPETKLSKPLSLYPSGIVAFAMVARGEIGFLISSVAETKGIFRGSSGTSSSSDEVSELFLIVTWAIVLCTVIGPLAVGLLVRRVRVLETRSSDNARADGHKKKNVLGVWGVS